MSPHERERMMIMAGVKRRELTQVQAAQLMGLCYRQTKRVWRRYQSEGDAGLVHRLRGQPGLRRKPPALRIQVLARYAEELAKEGDLRGSRHCASVVAGGGKTYRATAAAKAPAMAGAQAVLWGDGATGRLAS